MVLKNKMQKSLGSLKVCDYCHVPDRCVTRICLDCDKHLCDICVHRHAEKKECVEHKLVPVSFLLCWFHIEKLTSFCTDCNKFLCNVCSQAKVCEQHNVKDVDNVENETNVIINQCIDDVSQTIKEIEAKLQPAKRQAADCLSSLHVEEYKVNTYLAGLHHKLEEKKRELFNTVSEHRSKLQELKKQLNEDDKKLDLFH